jgi:hypothetical protein
MLLAEWCALKGRGAIHRLSLETRLAYTTVHKAARGNPTKPKTADLIVAATNGEVDRDSLILGRLPERTASKATPSSRRTK